MESKVPATNCYCLPIILLVPIFFPRAFISSIYIDILLVHPFTPHRFQSLNITKEVGNQTIGLYR
jgi:hypothetical protein